MYSAAQRSFGIILLFACFLDTRGQASIDCNRPPELVDPQTCCSDGGRDEVSEKCAQKFGLTSTQTQPPSMDVATCLAECVMRESKYLSGQTLNPTAIRADLQKRFPSDPEYVEVMTRSYQKCLPIAQRKLAEIQRSTQGAAMLQRKCSPLSGLILGCTYMEYFQNCPAGHWTASAQCNVSKQFLQKCAVF